MGILLWPVLLVAAQTAVDGAGNDLEAKLFAAVFHQQKAELLDAEARAQGIVLCLAIDPGDAPQSVSPETLKQLGLGPAVRRGAECEVRQGRAVEIATKRAAILVTVGPIEWIKADEAWVTVTQTWSTSKSLRRPYRVVREPDGDLDLSGPDPEGRPVLASAGQTFQSRQAVEPRIETEDLLDSVLLDHGEVDGVPSREAVGAQHDGLGP